MCRFLAFKGKEPILLKRLLSDPANSLISQSRLARETKTGLNADGFGIGWYNQSVDETPAIFKSIQPAWNDENLLNIASKVTSECFIGHVRASTVGDVSLANCHPFTCDEYLFAHNGTIDNFEAIRKDLLFFLEDDCFHKIKGQTDSEHFFYLIYNILKKHDESMGLAIIAALKKLNHILTKRQLAHNFRINACLTNGKTLSAIRFKSNADQPTLSLYYSQQHSPKSVIIASERLSEMNEEWLEIPSNHLLTVDEEINITLTPIHI